MNYLKIIDQNNSKIPIIIIVLFILFAMVMGLRTFLGLRLPSQSVQIKNTISAHTQVGLPDISALHLFGRFENNINLLPQTTLQLDLQGIMLSTSSTGHSYAIIGSNGVTKVYQTGDTVPGGAIIKAINKDQIILSENNQLASLKLPIPKLKNALYTRASF